MCPADTYGGVELNYCVTTGGGGNEPNKPVSSDWSNELTDANNGDYTLVADGNCVGNSNDDPTTGDYSNDYVDTAYSSPWDAGAYAYVDSVSIPIFMNNYRRRR